MTCTKCETSYADTADFCPVCGEVPSHARSKPYRKSAPPEKSVHQKTLSAAQIRARKDIRFFIISLVVTALLILYAGNKAPSAVESLQAGLASGNAPYSYRTMIALWIYMGAAAALAIKRMLRRLREADELSLLVLTIIAFPITFAFAGTYGILGAPFILTKACIVSIRGY